MANTLVDLITQFRIQFFDKFPYVSSYVYSLNPVRTNKVDTMAVDRTGNMYWNPDWCEKLTLDEGAYVVQHETWHLILRHCHLSDQILGPNPSQQQLYDMNVAMDTVIWEMLECVKEHAPEGGVTLPNMQERWPQIKSGMTCLEIYSIIRQNKPKLPDQPGQGVPQDGEEKTDGSQEGQTQGEDSPDDGEGEADGGQGGDEDTGGTGGGPDSEADDADRGGDPGREGDQSGGEGGDGDGSTGGSANGQGEGVDGEVQDYGYDKDKVNGGSAADGKPRDYEVDDNSDAWDAHMEDNLLRQVDQAIKIAEDDEEWVHRMGSCPGELKRVIKQKLYPQPDPWKQMAATIGLKVAGVMGQKDDTYQRRNRRQTCMQDGVILKGQQIMTPDVIVIMDTSGSMTTKCLNKCSIVCSQGCRAVGQYRLICWDDGLQHEEVIRGNKTEWPTPGNGGTDMTDAIRYALKYKPSVIILCTDGGTRYPDKEEMGRCQLIIALTQNLPTPEWAKRVRIPDPGKKDKE